MEQTQNHSLNT